MDRDFDNVWNVMKIYCRFLEVDLQVDHGWKQFNDIVQALCFLHSPISKDQNVINKQDNKWYEDSNYNRGLQFLSPRQGQYSVHEICVQWGLHLWWGRAEVREGIFVQDLRLVGRRGSKSIHKDYISWRLVELIYLVYECWPKTNLGEDKVQI